MKNNLLYFLLILFSCTTYCQISIGTPLPNVSSQLEVVATNNRALIPRINFTSSTGVDTIVNGNFTSLLVFNMAAISDIEPGLLSVWTSLVGANKAAKHKKYFIYYLISK